MSSTESAVRVAVCSNLGDCAKAVTGETLEWYPGAGEYCPECGEALIPSDAVSKRVAHAPKAQAQAASPRPMIVPTAAPTRADVAQPVARPRRGARFMTPLRWFWIVVTAVLAGGAIAYVVRRDAAVGRPAGEIAVCPIPSAQQLATDLVRSYAAKSAAPPGRFILTNAGACDVRFSLTPETPDAVIARDGIVAIVNPINSIERVSETQLRAIFSGSVRDWSQLGRPPGAIVPILPDADSDEAQVLASSLFFGVSIDRRVRRGGSSADVTREVTAPNRMNRGAIGLVAFSQAVNAKVVPLAYLPSPNVLSIASRRYPYTLTIAIQPGPGRRAAAASGLIEYAHSGDGAAIVIKNGLVPREGM